MLLLISAVLARIVSSIGIPQNAIGEVLSSAVSALEGFENSTQCLTPELDDSLELNNFVAQPPHRGHEVFQSHKKDELWTWGRTVELLWQVSIRCGVRHNWSNLTYRLLVWRSIAGRRRSPIGEWARAQTMQCVSSKTDRRCACDGTCHSLTTFDAEKYH